MDYLIREIKGPSPQRTSLASLGKYRMASQAFADAIAQEAVAIRLMTSNLSLTRICSTAFLVITSKKPFRISNGLHVPRSASKILVPQQLGSSNYDIPARSRVIAAYEYQGRIIRGLIRCRMTSTKELGILIFHPIDVYIRS